MKFKIILLSLLALISYNSNAQTTINTGNVQGTWNKAGSPYLINGDITVPAGQKLTITEGVKVEFQGHYRLRVYGSIQALGKINDVVLFTPKDTNVGWQGITVYEENTGNDSIIFDYSTIEYGRNFKYNFKIDTGVLHIQNHSKVRISNSSFFKNKGNRYNGIRLVKCSLLMYNCNFKENEAVDERVNGDNAALNCLAMLESTGTVDNCIFEQNKCWSPNNPNDSASGLSGSTCNFFSSTMSINNCEFRSNYATTSGAGASVAGNNSRITFNQCKFFNNSSRDGKVLDCAFGGNNNNQVQLNDCVFENNTAMDQFKPADIFMYSINAFGNILNVKNCRFTGAVGGGSVSLLENAQASFKNCVFENNNARETFTINRNCKVNMFNCRLTNNLGGITIGANCESKIYNSLIAYNGSPSDTFHNGLAVYDGPDKVNIYNSIITGNRSNGVTTNMVTFRGSFSYGVVNKFHNNILEGGTKATRKPLFASGVPAGVDTVTFNEVKNLQDLVPTFVNPPTTYGIAGYKPGLDFHLVNNCGNSPGYSHEQGTLANLDVPSTDTFPKTDFDGNARVRCEQIDIGPYEIEGLANEVSVSLAEDTLKVCPETNANFQSLHCGKEVSYQWQQETAPNTWNNLQTQPSQSANQTGNYRVIAQQIACGTKDTAYAWLENHPKPQPNLGNDKNLDINDSLTLDPGTFQTYTWNNGSSNSTEKLKPQQNGDTLVWVQVTDNNGCIGRDSVKITVSGVKNVQLLSKLNITAFPNPTNNILSFTGSQHIKSITIYDLQGREKLRQNSNLSSIDLGELPVGVYVLTIETTEGLSSLRVVKE